MKAIAFPAGVEHLADDAIVSARQDEADELAIVVAITVEFSRTASEIAGGDGNDIGTVGQRATGGDHRTESNGGANRKCDYNQNRSEPG